MAADELDPRLYYQLISGFIRTDSSPQEVERTNKNLQWLADNEAAVLRTMEGVDRDLMTVIRDYALSNETCPTRKIMENIIREFKGSAPDGMLALIEDYDTHSPDFPGYDHTEMPQLLRERKEDFDRYRLVRILKAATAIANVGVLPKSPKDKPLRGAKDAVGFVQDAISKGLIPSASGTLGGILRDRADLVLTEYRRIKEELKDRPLLIPTTFKTVDDTIGGMYPTSLVGVLGYTGQMKSTVCRSIVYSAVASGLRALCIPLESSAREEEDFYTCIHGAFLARDLKRNSLSVSQLRQGALSPEDESFLENTVVPSLKELRGELIVKQPLDQSWASIRTLIDAELHRGHLDIIYVDYLSKIDTQSAKDKQEAINQIAIEAKMLATVANEGRGTIFLTPMQANRDGWEKAGQNDGRYDATDVYRFSELERSADLILTVYTNEELMLKEKLKIGACKSRRSKPVAPDFFDVDGTAGAVVPEAAKTTYVTFAEDESGAF